LSDMRLIFLADDFPPEPGGIQTYSYELARAVAEAGAEVVVVASTQPGSETVDDAMPCPVVRVATSGGYAAAAVKLAAGAEEAATLLGGPPRCMVATKWAPEGPAAIWAARTIGRPFVLIGHGGEFSQARGQLIKWIVQRTVMRRAALFLANSSFTADLFRRAKAPADRIGIIYGGVRPERFEATDEQVEGLREEYGLAGKRVLATVSRLVSRKGHDIVLAAMPAILQSAPDAAYLIVGDGPMREKLEEQARELGLESSVVFAGNVADEMIPVCYRLCDALVMPSRPVRGELAEGLGLAYLEAAVCGKPSIGTNYGGIPDAIADGETGLLVDTNDIAGLASAATRLLGDEELRARLGEAARERALAEFTWERVAERFLAQVERIPVPTGCERDL